MLRRLLPLVFATLAALSICAVALVSLGCAGGDGYSSQALVAEARAPETATPAPAATPTASMATPVTFAVTPQPPAYHIVDPAFEPLPGARAYHGVHLDAAYQIEVPEQWNGDLVLFAHRYRAYSPELKVDAPPLREHLIERGYAWAASSYRVNGYAVGAGAEDTRRLARFFAETVGEPRRTFVFGTSLGGHVTTYLLERYPTELDGALAECGAVAGVGVLDYFASWNVLAAHFTGVADGLSNDPARYEAAIYEMGERLGLPDAPTLAGRRFESAIAELTGGPRPWRREGFLDAYGWNFFLVLDAVRHPEASISATNNLDVHYRIAPELGIAEDELNRTVPRLAPAPGARDGSLDPALAPITGRIQRPYITLHNTGDLYVPIDQEQVLRRAVRAAGRDGFLVQRAIRRPGHCNITQQERIRAFDDLVRWVEEGVRPAGDDLLGDLMQAGLDFTEPLSEGDPGTP